MQTLPNTGRLAGFRIVVCCLIFSFAMPWSIAHAAEYPGLPTRDQNPLLLGYLIPATPVATSAGWSVSHSLFITNTYQVDQAGQESLIIDSESLRYDLQADYAIADWSLGVQVSFIDTSRGTLDNLIEDWHDFFGLPQGGRDKAPTDRLLLLYRKGDQEIINITEKSSDLGDLQLTARYQLSPAQQIGLTLKLPSTSDNELYSNGEAELALAYSLSAPLKPALDHYGTIAISSIANAGLLEDRLHSALLSGQYGLRYRFNDLYHALIQADYHSPLVKHSKLDAFDHSLQLQFVLRLARLPGQQQLDIFFSEDIAPGHAPDITFALRLSTGVF